MDFYSLSCNTQTSFYKLIFCYLEPGEGRDNSGFINKENFFLSHIHRRISREPGVLTHAFNPNNHETEAGRSEFEASLSLHNKIQANQGHIVRSRFLKKSKERPSKIAYTNYNPRT